MAFVPQILSFGTQHPRQIQFQYHTIVQQPVMPVLQPQFLLMPQVQTYHLPVSMMMPTTVAHLPFTPPLFIMAPAQSSILPPGANINPPRGITLRIIFYGHASDDSTPPICLSSAAYKDSLPNRDALLAGIATWAGHHGLSIRHPGGRIDPLRVKMYVLPKGNSVLSGMDIVPGVGLVVPGDVIKMVRLGGIEEEDWEEALREIKKEGYEAVVAVDMSVSAGGDDNECLDTTTTTATDTIPTPTAATDGDQAADAA
ncbi:hypothetical protein GGI43DRAFT_388439 [Trichoderma evansii]